MNIEVDVNSKFELIAESVFKQKFAVMLLKLNKAMGNAHTAEEITYVAQETWRPIYFRNKTVPFGILYSYYDNSISGSVSLKKITVQTILSSLQTYINDFKEKDRINRARFINEIERKQAASGLLSAKSPIGAAACWLISKRCDGVDVDYLSTKQVAECIERGINPDFLIKQENAR